MTGLTKEEKVKRDLLRHFLGALAYRTQKALRGAPSSFADFQAGEKVRTPHRILAHMDGVLGYAMTHFEGGDYDGGVLDDLSSEIERFHKKLEALAGHLEKGTPFIGTTAEQMIQGPFADAMTHAGQLAMLRRLEGSPVPPKILSWRTSTRPISVRINRGRPVLIRDGLRHRRENRNEIKCDRVVQFRYEGYGGGICVSPERVRDHRR